MTTFETGIAQRLFRPVLQRPQNDRRDFLRRVFLIAQRDGDLLAHLPLDRPDRPFRAQNVLVAGGLADQQLALGFSPTTDGRMDRRPLENDGPAVADDRYFAVGRSQIDADDRVSVHVSIPHRSGSRLDRSSNRPGYNRVSWSIRPSGSVSDFVETGLVASGGGRIPGPRTA